MADYIDPVEAAKRRQVPKNVGTSYFPGVRTFSNDDLTAGSIFKPGKIDEIMGDVPTPTPTPTPVPRLLVPVIPRYVPPNIDELVKRYAY